ERGQRVTELMKQAQYSPMSVAEMAVSLFAVDRGYMDDVELAKIGSFESAMLDYMNNSQVEFMENLAGGDWNDELETQMTSAVDDFKSTGSW
ncbi:MAG: F0F1 ATP synthase subunit alpha, partial [Gammaproteobacteria bacterium]